MSGEFPLGLLFEHNPLPMWVFDRASLRFLDVNRAAIERYGYTRSEFLAMSCLEIRPPEDRDRFEAYIRSADSAQTHRGVRRHRARSGESFEVEILAQDIEFRGSSARLVAAIDLTERRPMRRLLGAVRRDDTTEEDRALEEARFLRLQRMESLGALASGLAHDLNNMLAPMLMAGEILRGKDLDAEARSLVDVIETSARRAAELVTQVLCLGRDLDATRVAIEPGALLRHLARLARQTLPPSSEVRIDVDSGDWMVRGVPAQVQQILMNLVVNARDAMPEGGVLTLRATSIHLGPGAPTLGTGTPGQYVVFEVADTGPGISSEVLARLFEPFFTTKGANHGTGLGLATALAIAKEHDGFLRVQSTLGEGSKCQLYLPAEAPPSHERKHGRLEDAPRGDGQLILVVEDQVSIRSMTQAVLEAFGYRVLTADNGSEALALWDQLGGEVSIVITDLLMPVMDGAALTAALRARDPELPILIATGAPGDALAEEARVAGAAEMLDEPYSAETLLLAVGRLTRMR